MGTILSSSGVPGGVLGSLLSNSFSFFLYHKAGEGGCAGGAHRNLLQDARVKCLHPREATHLAAALRSQEGEVPGELE